MDDIRVTSEFITADDGLRLHVRSHLPDTVSGLPVVCLPGLTRSHRDFTELAEHLAGSSNTPRTVHALDYRGRGRSDRDKSHEKYNVFQELADLQNILTAKNIHRAHFVGTSRGGILIMLMAAARPGALASVVLNDVGPVIETTGLVRIKRTLAMLREPDTWVEATEILKRYGRPAFPSFSDDDWLRFTRQTFADRAGRPAIDYDRTLEKLLEPIGSSTPPVTLWPQFKGLTPIKTLVIRGALSTLLLPETVAKMVEMHPKLTAIEVPDQGHAPVLWDKNLLDRILAHMNRAEHPR